MPVLCSPGNQFRSDTCLLLGPLTAVRVSRRDAECMGRLVMYLVYLHSQSLPLPGPTNQKQPLVHKLCKYVASQQGCDCTGAAEQSEALALVRGKEG